MVFVCGRNGAEGCHRGSIIRIYGDGGGSGAEVLDQGSWSDPVIFLLFMPRLCSRKDTACWVDNVFSQKNDGDDNEKDLQGKSTYGTISEYSCTWLYRTAEIWGFSSPIAAAERLVDCSASQQLQDANALVHSTESRNLPNLSSNLPPVLLSLAIYPRLHLL